MKQLIRRSGYRTLTQSDLIVFTQNVVEKTKNQPEYAAHAAMVQLLETRLAEYVTALGRSLTGGLNDTLQKDVAKSALTIQLDALAGQLELASNGSLVYLANTGFALRGTPQRATGPVPPPIITRAAATGVRGEVRVAVQHAEPEAVNKTAVEYSTDKGATWHNGTYSGRRQFVINGLPHSPELWVRVRALATRDRVSPWSEPAMVAVP